MKEAEEAGHSILFSTEKTLQIDCDKIEQLEQCWRMYNRYKKDFQLFEPIATHSKSGAWHVVIQTSKDKGFEVPERLVLQAAFGSDPDREALNLKDWYQNKNNIPFFIEVGSVPETFSVDYIKAQKVILSMERITGKIKVSELPTTADVMKASK